MPRYFAALPALGSGLARVWCRDGFPHHAAEAAAVLAGERCLETGHLPARYGGSSPISSMTCAAPSRCGQLPSLGRLAPAGGPRCA